MWLSVPLLGRENLTQVGVHRIQGKCDYPYLTLNALLRTAVFSVRARKCGYSECGIRSRTSGYKELSEVRPSYSECPTPNIGTIRSPALYKMLLRLEHRVKTDLHNKYMFNFASGSFFEQDHLLSLIVLGVYAKR